MVHHIPHFFFDIQSNKWLWFLRDGPSEKGILELSQYLVFWGYAYFAVTAMLLGKMEDNKLTKEDELGVTATYVTMWDLLRLPRASICVSFHGTLL